MLGKQEQDERENLTKPLRSAISVVTLSYRIGDPVDDALPTLNGGRMNSRRILPGVTVVFLSWPLVGSFE